ncbi:MAG TPA: LPS export ABC transporter periplasmic protein LptC, partial [Alcanivorax sp.]|nr:LPS export ABC transporter periplasmic protein LptC [Alcanivorax sp.]HBY49643.1 LPS export ABC transporter periplasmic protein LptC [Alcanivorax sp.]HCI10621.1 LPS export ABC transporter periplasmic protein LptC [Alcanivorax sp.]HCJ64055.1 LPS export ABC transporter periplasmic protein LptC [Alcanivorax sp.]HCO63497.1 LPS export ABC transporter periplasmic protein LptC [Alcanivorax sp.]
EQYERDALTTLTEPVLRMDNSNGLWTIQSRRGEVRDNGDLIVFTDQVEARSESNGVTLDTEELQYHNDTNRVVSPGELAMRHRDGRTRAGAMESDLTSGEMTLKQGVVSEFTGSTE